MTYSLPQLAAEINTDPKALGYAALKTAQNWAALAAKLNATYAGVGTVFRPAIPASEVLANVNATELAAMTALRVSQFALLLTPATIDATNANVRNQFAAIFPNGTSPTTLASLTTMAHLAAPTRAEELWGAGTVVDPADIPYALAV